MTPLVHRTLRIALLGLFAAAAVAAAGRVLERATIGADADQARARVEREVRDAFERLTRDLRATGAALGRPDAVRAVRLGDAEAARDLFASAAEVVRGRDGVAVTVYGGDGSPLAWAGRTSDLPASIDQDRDAWFMSPGPRGARVVFVRPILDGTARLGSVAVERPVPLVGQPGVFLAGFRDLGADAFRFPTSIAPVSLQFAFEGEPQQSTGSRFDVMAPSGVRLAVASLSDEDIEVTRQRWRRAARSAALFVLALAVALVAGPLLDERNRTRRASRYALASVSVAAAVAAARLLLLAASPAEWSQAPLFSDAEYASRAWGPLLGSPFDFLASMVAAGAIAGLLLAAVFAWRTHRRNVRIDTVTRGQRAAFLGAQVAAGAVVAIVVVVHRAILADTVAHTAIDLLQYSVRPLSAARLALQTGLVVAHATAVACGVAALVAASTGWRIRRGDWALRVLAIGAWTAPGAAWAMTSRVEAATPWPLAMTVAAIVAIAAWRGALSRWYRHGSQAFRLALAGLALILPSCVVYPAVFQVAWRAKTDLVETRYAPQALNQRQTVQRQVRESLREIDRAPGLEALLAGAPAPGAVPSTDQAFQVWQATSLAQYPVTSSIELYGADGGLLSRFAFNLPEDLTAPISEERTCDWDLYEGVAPFFAEERRVLHAGRLLCAPDPSQPPLGSIVVRAILDYANLPFISSRDPYVELMRPSGPEREGPLAGRDVEYAVYGWSRTPLFQSGDRAWPLTDEVFARVELGRGGVWARLARGDQPFDVYLMNDRGGIYALGVPSVSPLEHLVNLAEIVVLSAGVYLLLLVAKSLFGVLAGRRMTAPALLREVRASFYRKLFIAFVAAVVVPVAALAVVTRNYVADQRRAGIAQEAVRTVSAARRVVEDLVAPRAAQRGTAVDDNLMVWVSRLIDQDANVFSGARLQATNERNLFASGLLPTRTPAEAYAALELRREAATVTTEQIGTAEHLVVATPLTLRQPGPTILSLPLTSRQREIDQEIDSLDRRVLLSVLLFTLAGAGLGYSLAERISDPVNRLTRATRRIARGKLDTRIAATSADELGRLVADFNGMALELQRQRGELERTNRLEAWAEMARQVAHEIKNPLTPIQLNAEHLRRVHADQGRPLHPVLEECVETILAQVGLLRQIASEFSNFASSPIARPATVDVAGLLRDVLDPYEAGIAGRIAVVRRVDAELPPVFVDRTLVARALANVVENALHAMPGSGTLSVSARAEAGAVSVRVSDTGAGMDAEALSRAFEPYFSTKASGTGLGLPIAKRNVEIAGGSIRVSSGRETGTTVEFTLPVRERP